MANVAVILELVDSNGIDGILINEQFEIKVSFQDLTQNNQAVFSGFVDVNFVPNDVKVNTISYANIYSDNGSFQSGEILTTVVNEVGAMANINKISIDNKTVIPQDNLVFTLKMTALKDLTENGTTITTDKGDDDLSEITIFGNDNDQRDNTNYGSLTVGNISNPTNTPPTISNINNLTMGLGNEISPITFTISDQETNANDLVITAVSDNNTLLDSQNIIISGSGENRTLNITPTANQTGTTTVSLTVSDGELNSVETFDLNIREITPNQANLTIQDGDKSLNFAGGGNDILDLSNQNSSVKDRLYLGSGNDNVYLGTNDFVASGKGDDKLFVVTGGGNILAGGLGKDEFWIANETLPNATVTQGILPDSPNLIVDFKRDEDKIGINGFGVNIGNIQESINVVGNNTHVDINNETIAIILGVSDINSSDFIFS